MTYSNATDARTAWTRRGYDHSTLTDEEVQQLLLAGSEFCDGMGARETSPGIYITLLPGYPTGGRAQERQWPRTGAADSYGTPYEEDEIPPALIRAVHAAAWYAKQNAGGLNVVFKRDQIVQSRRVETIARTFFEPKSVNGLSPTRPQIPEVDANMALVLSGVAGNPYGITGVVA